MKLALFCLLTAAVATLASCMYATDEVRPPVWIRGAWRGHDKSVAGDASRDGDLLRITFSKNNGTILRRGGAFPGINALSEFECTELEKTSSAYQVRVQFSAFNADPTEAWRWESTDGSTLRFWPLYGQSPVTISLSKETFLQTALFEIGDVLLGILNTDSDNSGPTPPRWIQGIWQGPNTFMLNGAPTTEGQVRWSFTEKDASVIKRGGVVQGETKISDCYWKEVESGDAFYSIRLYVPAFNEYPVETWRWEKSTLNTLTYWPLYGRAPLTVTLTLWE